MTEIALDSGCRDSRCRGSQENTISKIWTSMSPKTGSRDFGCRDLGCRDSGCRGSQEKTMSKIWTSNSSSSSSSNNNNNNNNNNKLVMMMMMIGAGDQALDSNSLGWYWDGWAAHSRPFFFELAAFQDDTGMVPKKTKKRPKKKKKKRSIIPVRHPSGNWPLGWWSSPTRMIIQSS